MLSVLLAGGVIALGHGDEKDENAGAVENDTLAPDAATTLDMAYAKVNSRFEEVRPIFEKSCFDCHSKFTDYPWYHSLPLVKGFLDGHIKEAREHLDMSDDFPFGGHASQLEQLQEIKNEIEEGGMPPWSYRIMHWGLMIENERRDSVFRWIDESLTQIEAAYREAGIPIPDDDEH